MNVTLELKWQMATKTHKYEIPKAPVMCNILLTSSVIIRGASALRVLSVSSIIYQASTSIFRTQLYPSIFLSIFLYLYSLSNYLRIYLSIHTLYNLSLLLSFYGILWYCQTCIVLLSRHSNAYARAPEVWRLLTALCHPRAWLHKRGNASSVLRYGFLLRSDAQVTPPGYEHHTLLFCYVRFMKNPLHKQPFIATAFDCRIHQHPQEPFAHYLLQQIPSNWSASQCLHSRETVV